MGLDVYFRRDLANILRASALANTDTGDKREGFMRALMTVGLAVGLEPVPQEKRQGDAALVIPAWIEPKR